jgi:hypothetical protein
VKCVVTAGLVAYTAMGNRYSSVFAVFSVIMIFCTVVERVTTSISLLRCFPNKIGVCKGQGRGCRPRGVRRTFNDELGRDAADDGCLKPGMLGLGVASLKLAAAMAKPPDTHWGKGGCLKWIQM